MRNPKVDQSAAAARGLQQQHPATTTPPATKSTQAPAASTPAQPTPAPVTAPAPPVQQVQAPPVMPPVQPVPASIHTVSINAGTPFSITLAQDVPVKLAAGDKIKFTVTKDVKVGDVVVIAKGTPLTGDVVDPGDSKKLLIVKGKATFKLSSVESAAGTKLVIRAIPSRDKAERQIEQQGTKNKDVLAPAGTEYLAYVDSDQVVTVKR